MNEQLLIPLIMLAFFIVYKKFRAKQAISTLSELNINEIQLVDVRSEAEFARFNAPESLNIPVQSLISGSTKGLENSKTIVVYCASGMRSVTAATWLKKQGYKVINAGTVGNVIQGIKL
ncbi:rhodanese-like domain-containing protein [Vibrio sp. MACH09]|uniref:rhodanese-like domain-containing protein n=1 Tax=Vibrio sp. MACH09 TaxID=3025122 RepID=UPI00278D9E6A|nr:rhodanese-like domain-containing protein [Vibrio sp. MACH09]GLO61941.1 rhodanese-like domain-containing protein [Vibrio sp. MACH09]